MVTIAYCNKCRRYHQKGSKIFTAHKRYSEPAFKTYSIKNMYARNPIFDTPTSVSKTKYSWGTFRVLEKGNYYYVPIHQEHWDIIKKVYITGIGSSFKDETGRQWIVKIHPEDKGILLYSDGGSKVLHLNKANIKKLWDD